MSQPAQPLPWSQRILRRGIDRPLFVDGGQRLRERRKDRPDAVQFEEIEDRRGRSMPVVTGELLLRTTDLTPDAEAALSSFRLTAEPVPELDGAILRIKLPQDRRARLKETHDALRDAGVRVSPTAVVPMGAAPVPTVVWKSLCPPVPVGSLAVPPPAAPPLPPVGVTVLDTGIADQQRTDGWLAGLIHPNRDNVDPLDDYPIPNGRLDLGAGHGSFVAGILQRFAPAAQLDVRRTLDSDGVTEEVRVAAAMLAAARDGAAIINLSLGTQTYDDQEPPALAAAVDLIHGIEQDEGREILVVAAAGNSASTDPVYPAAFGDVLAVAALTPALTPAAWSSSGPWVDCWAVGENVVSTYVQGTEDPFVRPGDPGPGQPPNEYGPNSWAVWSGTSFAAPQVAGRIARMAQEQGIGVRAARDRLFAGSGTKPGVGVVIA